MDCKWQPPVSLALSITGPSSVWGGVQLAVGLVPKSWIFKRRKSWLNIHPYIYWEENIKQIYPSWLVIINQMCHKFSLFFRQLFISSVRILWGQNDPSSWIILQSKMKITTFSEIMFTKNTCYSTWIFWPNWQHFKKFLPCTKCAFILTK